MRAGEPETMRGVAAGLVAYAEHQGLDEDAAVRAWAQVGEAFEHAPRVDRWVGTKELGPALYCYLRMRGGGDAVKPDVRVRRGLRSLGFGSWALPHDVLVVATQAAQGPWAAAPRA